MSIPARTGSKKAGETACPSTLRQGGAGAFACHWSFYIFSSGGGAHELGIGDFDFEFLQKLGVLAHLLA
jgi:hypothetical protein